MTPVYLLGRNDRPILGSSLSELCEIAARRAGLPLVDRLPETGEVILVDPDAAVTSQALVTIAAAHRASDSLPLVDRRHLVARVDVAWLRNRRIPTVDSLLGRNVELIDLPTASYRGRFERAHAEDVLVRASATEPRNHDVENAFVKLFARSNVRPITVFLLGAALAVASCVPLAYGGPKGLVAAAFILWAAKLLDGAAVHIARLKGERKVPHVA
jgi:hypothetical protein